jgi:hypothetical protein
MEANRDHHGQARDHDVQDAQRRLLGRSQPGKSDCCRSEDRDEQTLRADAEQKADADGGSGRDARQPRESASVRGALPASRGL